MTATSLNCQTGAATEEPMNRAQMDEMLTTDVERVANEMARRLQGLGISATYAATYAATMVEEHLVSFDDLTNEDLKELGFKMGDRKKVLSAQATSCTEQLTAQHPVPTAAALVSPDYSNAPPRPPWLAHTGPMQLSIPPPCWGISRGQIVKLLRYIRTTDKYKQLKQQHGRLNMYILNDEFLIPWTANCGCSIALLLNPEGLEAEGMLSHAWAEDEEEFEDALTKGLQTDGDPALWVCTFAQYQAKKNDSIADIGPTIAEQVEVDPFSQLISSTGVEKGLGLIVVHTSNAELYSRLWCAYEMGRAVGGIAKISAIMSSSYGIQLREDYDRYRDIAAQDSAEAFRLFCQGRLEVNTESAKCSFKSDEEMIRGLIMQRKDGFALLDDIILNLRKQFIKDYITAAEEEQSILEQITKQEKNQEDRKQLLKAATDGNISAVMALLSAGVDPNVAEPETNNTPLMKAAVEGHTEVVKSLLDADAEVDAVCSLGFAALHAAAFGGHLLVLKLLLCANASINGRAYEEGHSLSPLNAAAMQGHLPIVKALVSAQADVNSHDSDGQTSLMYAAGGCQAEVMEVLLRAGASVGARENSGMTCLMFAAQQGHKEVVDRLLRTEAYATVESHGERYAIVISEAQDNAGWTALMFAAAAGHLDVVKALWATHDVYHDGNGRTAQDLAEENGHTDIVEYIKQRAMDQLMWMYG